MLEKAVAYFAERHLLSNLILVLVLLGGVAAWHTTSKEEMPDITFDTVRVNVKYPGASAEDVEYLVTRPIEEVIRGVDGVFRIDSVSNIGDSSITVELERKYPHIQEAFTEIRNAVFNVNLPDDIRDDPSVRMFKTSKKAVLDVALVHTEKHLLDGESRRLLQEYSLALENQLLARGSVNSVNRKGYHRPEIHIKTYPEKLLKYAIPFSVAMDEIRRNHVRQPAGNIEAPEEPKVTLLSELDNVKNLSEVIIQGGFEGQVVRLGEVAQIEEAFEKNKTILKVNGREAVMMSVVKNSSSGILKALEDIESAVESFQKNVLTGTPVQVVLLDDESIDIRNRLSLIGINGTIGFFLIIFTLFIFLNKRAGIWVAMGIPFTMGFTMLAGSFLGYTVNGTTLAAVIIVMGIVVDDAIVVAENITRLIQKGVAPRQAVVQGTVSVGLPIVASIVTTCIVFIPFFFFTGRFGRFIEHIPPIIFLMLAASLFESLFILPGHMHFESPFVQKLKRWFFRGNNPKEVKAASGHWFEKVEERYSLLLRRVLPHKQKVFTVFVVLLVFSGWIASSQMRFVMFPNEETRDIVLLGKTPEGTSRYETAERTKEIEKIFLPYMGKEVVGFRNEIAESRRGGAVEENRFRIIVEIVPRDRRKKSADQLIAEFKREIDKVEGFEEINFQKSRRRQESGSPVELIVQENNETQRRLLVEELASIMGKHRALTAIETDEGLRVPEYRVEIDRDKVKRLAINPEDIAATFRAALEGTVLYEYFNGEEYVYVRFSVVDEAKGSIEKVLSLPVENRGNYLVPLKDIVRIEKITSANAVSRRNLKRTAYIYADMAKNSGMTPLELAEDFEQNIFPGILRKYPSAVLTFGGEIQDTRESQADFGNAIVMVLVLIYTILAVLLNSLFQPFIIMTAIPFGVVGVILAFWLHGKVLFGFYAAVGVLGLAGVVINDSIIMMDKLNREYDSTKSPEESDAQIAQIAQTRLRAVVLTTLTTVAGVLPTAYGFAGYDAMLAEMMLALCWGLVFGTLITLVLIPCLYSLDRNIRYRFHAKKG